jgi:hypothetical protein
VLTVYRPEVFTTELRAKANAVVQVIHYSISLIITQCSPIALERVGWKYYVSFLVRPNAGSGVPLTRATDSVHSYQRFVRRGIRGCLPGNKR